MKRPPTANAALFGGLQRGSMTTANSRAIQEIAYVVVMRAHALTEVATIALSPNFTTVQSPPAAHLSEASAA